MAGWVDGQLSRKKGETAVTILDFDLVMKREAQ